MTSRTWKEWYAVRTGRNLAFALRKARAMAAADHPDTPPETMMTPEVRQTPVGWHVFVIGKPDKLQRDTLPRACDRL